MATSPGKKLLFIGPQPPQVGGSFAVGGALTNGMAERGYVQTVITPPWGDQHEFYDKEAAKRSITIHRLDRPVVVSSRPPPSEELERVGALVRRVIADNKNHPFDVGVLGHDSFAWYAPILKENGIPIVQRLGGTPTRAIFANPPIYPPAETQTFIDNVKLANQYACISYDFQNILINNLGISADKICVMGTSVDAELFSPKPRDKDLLASLSIPPDAKVVLHVSAFARVKRIEDIVDAAPEVVREAPNTYFVLVGPEPDTHQARTTEAFNVRAYVEQSPVKGNFRLTGLIDPSRVSRYFNIADAFVVASESEGFSLSAIEAQASGVYLIMSDCPAGFERTLNDTIGTTYSRHPKDQAPANLARAILSVVKEEIPDLSTRTEAARYHVTRNFSKPVWLDKYEGLLQKAQA